MAPNQVTPRFQAVAYCSMQPASLTPPDLLRRKMELEIRIFYIGDHESPVNVARTVKLPLTFIWSTSVLLSVWKDEYRKDGSDSSNSVVNLASSLLCENISDSEGEENFGLSSARSVSNNSSAVSVELVSLFAPAYDTFAQALS